MCTLIVVRSSTPVSARCRVSESDARHNGPHGRAGTTSHWSRSGRPSRLSSTIAIARTATLKPRTVSGAWNRGKLVPPPAGSLSSRRMHATESHPVAQRGPPLCANYQRSRSTPLRYEHKPVTSGQTEGSMRQGVAV